MLQSQFGFLSALRPDLHHFGRPVTHLTEAVEQHGATGARLGLGVGGALVEDVTVVQVPHQLQGTVETGALVAGEEREDSRQSLHR